MATVRIPLPLVESSAARDAAHAFATLTVSGLSGTPDDPPRNLLVRGNTKLGEDVCHFDLPAVQTCPGKSRVCSAVVKTGPRSRGTRHCYALRLYDRWPGLRKRHERNLEALADLPGFARRVVREITRRHVRALRWHVAGDVFSPEYARAMLSVMRETRETDHLLYTRSWRVPRIRPVLDEMAHLDNVAVWFSCDASTGLPDAAPEGVRLAWMALHAGEGEAWACGDDIAACDLVFLDAPLRRLMLSWFADVPTCPQERDPETTCTSCRRCLPQRDQ